LTPPAGVEAVELNVLAALVTERPPEDVAVGVLRRTTGIVGFHRCPRCLWRSPTARRGNFGELAADLRQTTLRPGDPGRHIGRPGGLGLE